eukprot:289551-Prymnesium_polylepis.1
MIDGVFFDDFSTSYNIIAGPPWGRNVVNIPNCTRQGGVRTISRPGAAHCAGAGCEALMEGTLDLVRRVMQLLNAHGKVPIFGDVDLFSNWNGVPIYMAEQRFVDALRGLQYVRYYEGAGAYADAVKPGGLYDSLRLEGQQQMAVGAHAYYPSAATDVTPHLASFLLFREEHWYYFGSTGWMLPLVRENRYTQQPCAPRAHRVEIA